MLTRPAGQKLEQGPALFRASARRFMLCGWGHLGPRTPGLARGLGSGTAGLLEYLSLCLRGLPNLAAPAAERAQSERKERKQRRNPYCLFPAEPWKSYA